MKSCAGLLLVVGIGLNLLGCGGGGGAESVPTGEVIVEGLRSYSDRAGAVTLEWFPVAGAESYRVYADGEPYEDFNPVVLAETEGTRYTHSGQLNGTFVRYFVSAMLPGGQESLWAGVETNIGLRWVLPMQVYGHPAVADDGTMIVCATTADLPAGGVFRVTASGEATCIFADEALPYPKSPVIGPTGRIYCSAMWRDEYETLVALDMDGRLRWSLWLRGLVSDGYPAVEPYCVLANASGRVYVLARQDENFLMAIDDEVSSGALAWTYPLGYLRGHGLTFGPDGTIYAGGEALRAISDKGTNAALRWSYETQCTGVFPVVSDGWVYGQSGGSSLLMVLSEASGALISCPGVPFINNGRPSFTADGGALLGAGYDSYTWTLTALNRDLSIRWQKTDSAGWGLSTVAEGDKAAFCALNGCRVVDLTNGDILWSVQRLPGGLVSCEGDVPVLLGDGTLVFACQVGNGRGLVAFHSDLTGPALSSPWPTAQRTQKRNS